MRRTCAKALADENWALPVTAQARPADNMRRPWNKLALRGTMF